MITKKLMGSVTSYNIEPFNKLKLSELNAPQWQFLLYSMVQSPVIISDVLENNPWKLLIRYA